MAQKSPYTLYYFAGRGRAELIRWILSAAGVGFNERRLKLDEWFEIKSSKILSKPRLYAYGEGEKGGKDAL